MAVYDKIYLKSKEVYEASTSSKISGIVYRPKKETT